MELRDRQPGFLGRSLAPKRNLRLPEKHRALLTGLALIAGAVVLGGYAHRTSVRWGIHQWTQNSAPTARDWERVLTSHGLERVRKPETIHRLLRTLPVGLDTAHSVWISAERTHVAVFAPEEQSPRIYAVRGARAPFRAAGAADDAWTRLPSGGWPGLAGVLGSLAGVTPSPSDTFNSTVTKRSVDGDKRSATRDPRKVEY